MSARRAVLLVAMLALVAVAAVSVRWPLGSQLARSLDELRVASPLPLWLAALAFLAMVVGSAGAWRSVFRSCGAELGLADACARYGMGSLVNSLAPARAGDAVRLGLFAKALPGSGRGWTAGGAFGAIGAARALAVALLVVCGVASGSLPVWPLLVLLGIVTGGAALALMARKRSPGGRTAHVLDAFRAFGRSPREAGRVFAWVGLSTAARVVAAAAVAAAFGVPDPLAAALIITPALDLAGMLPITPGNVGIASAAVTMALQSRGVDLTTALSAGIAFHAVETAVGLSFGVASAVALASYPSASIRRWTVRVAGATACLGLAAAFSATVLVRVV